MTDPLCAECGFPERWWRHKGEGGVRHVFRPRTKDVCAECDGDGAVFPPADPRDPYGTRAGIPCPSCAKTGETK